MRVRWRGFPAESAVPLLTSEKSMSLLNGLPEHGRLPDVFKEVGEEQEEVWAIGCEQGA